ncbi:actin-like ATPase domain-containing protein [Hesseltinella vesiculosa]|uniref:Actin-like ATPase domain-containing protein n=1 Tax=Hesseltinella vesiculosa TaxID=101127 RepID=A0A1X2GXT4_9FUNG|nr:actin-like ATPase domain-containing protein [Hesseltinella vesiculosa]
MDSPGADYAYVVGIDFGTTFSGCCYGYTKESNLDDYQDITSWPRQRIVAYPKTPTVSLYKKDTRDIKSWGDAAKSQSDKPNMQDHYLEKFKLYLDEESAKTMTPLPNGLTPVQVIADYLRSIHAYICETMNRGFAQNYEQNQYRYCLTVPATWSDQAKAVMREASIQAGLVERNDPIERLTLISEPEAAALYCQKTCDQFKMTAGQRFMICDAGGGTVDLIVFEIEDNLQGSAHHSLREVTKGSGDTCGSVFLDRNMEQLIRDRFAHFGRVKPRSMDSMLNSFIEHIKPHFFEEPDQEHYINIPFSLGYPNNEDPDYGIYDGAMSFTFEELRDKVFEPVIQKILGLIQHQLDSSAMKPVDAIFMVGGFGMSTYLQHRVRETFVPRVRFVSTPPRPEMAVVRGAVYFGMNPRLVTQRVSRRTYGLSSQMIFDPANDPPSHQINVNGSWYCRERFSVYVNKGTAVGVDECVTKKFVVTYPHSTETDLFAFDDDGPTPRLVTDPRVKVVARFPIQMPAFPDLRYGDQVPMTIHMYFGLIEIKIEVWMRDQRFTFTSRLDLADSAPPSVGPAVPAKPSPTLSTATSLPPYSSPVLSHTKPPAPPSYGFNKPDAIDPTSPRPGYMLVAKPDQQMATPSLAPAPIPLNSSSPNLAGYASVPPQNGHSLTATSSKHSYSSSQILPQHPPPPTTQSSLPALYPPVNYNNGDKHQVSIDSKKKIGYSTRLFNKFKKL